MFSLARAGSAPSGISSACDFCIWVWGPAWAERERAGGGEGWSCPQRLSEALSASSLDPSWALLLPACPPARAAARNHHLSQQKDAGVPSGPRPQTFSPVTSV